MHGPQSGHPRQDSRGQRKARPLSPNVHLSREQGRAGEMMAGSLTGGQPTARWAVGLLRPRARRIASYAPKEGLPHSARRGSPEGERFSDMEISNGWPSPANNF